MSYQSDRDRCLYQCGVQGIGPHIARALLRASTTLQRLAEAQCNGDYPADNGVRPVVECPTCGSSWVRASMRYDTHVVPVPGADRVLICPDCAVQRRVRAVLPSTWKPYFQGDPRGPVLQIFPSDTSDTDIYCGRASSRAIYIPAR